MLFLVIVRSRVLVVVPEVTIQHAVNQGNKILSRIYFLINVYT